MTNSKLQKKFSERWRGYEGDPDSATIQLRYKKIRALITEKVEGTKILDIGCADGSLLEPLISQYEVYGVEISDYLTVKAGAIGIRVTQANVENGLPFNDHAFDVVVASEIIEHIVDTDFFLAECNRVLKKGGKLILSTPNINTLFSPLIMSFFDYPPPGASRYRSHHVKDFTLSTARIALHNNGFAIEKECGVALFIPLLSRFLSLRSKAANLFPRCADELIIKAEKIKNAEYSENAVIDNIISRSVIKSMPVLKWFFKS